MKHHDRDRKFRSILITGASHGIGRALSLRYAAQGIVLGLCAADDLQQTATDCEKLGATVVTANLDIRSKNFVKWCREFDKNHPVDLLIANAGISPATSRFGLDTDIKSTNEILEINVLGTTTTINALLGKLVSRRRGHILIMSSIAAYIATGDSPAYCSSKAAILSYGRAIRHRLKDYGVGVTVACPGYIRTRLTDKYSQNESRLIDPDICAKRVAHAVARNKSEIAFPFGLAMTARLMYAFPQGFIDWWVKKYQYQ